MKTRSKQHMRYKTFTIGINNGFKSLLYKELTQTIKTNTEERIDRPFTKEIQTANQHMENTLHSSFKYRFKNSSAIFHPSNW